MSRQYKRVYDLNIDVNGQRRVVSGLRIKFEVKKSLRSYPNLAKIIIYNASLNTQAALKSKLCTITLNVGYEGYKQLVFTGGVRNVVNEKKSSDTTVTVYAGDGQRDWESSFFSSTFKPSVKVHQMVRQMAQTFENAIIGPIDQLGQTYKDRALSFAGVTRETLDALAKDYSFQWSIQDNVFEAIKETNYNASVKAVKIDQATGMIGSPTITDQGVEVRTLLNPAARPNGPVFIQSVYSNVVKGNLFFRQVGETRATGYYKIFEVTHTGDTHSNDWFTDILGLAL